MDPHKDIQLCEVIISRQTRRGEGVKNDPIRRITQVFTKDGELIAEDDPSPGTFVLLDLVHFAKWVSNDSINAKPQDVYDWLDSMKG